MACLCVPKITRQDAPGAPSTPGVPGVPNTVVVTACAGGEEAAKSKPNVSGPSVASANRPNMFTARASLPFDAPESIPLAPALVPILLAPLAPGPPEAVLGT